MIVCSRCGFENENSDAFCGSCATFLEWDGRKVAEETPPEPEPEPAVQVEPEARPGLIDRVREAIGIGEDDDAPPVAAQEAPAPAPAPEPAPAGEVRSVPVASVAVPVGPAVSAMGGEARTATPPPPPAPLPPPPPAPLPVPPQRASDVAAVPEAPPAQPAPVPDGIPGPVQPAAVKPAAVKARPAPKRPTTAHEINPGDKICGQCGEGNDPQRRFCRRCGASLIQAEVYSLPWYSRLWRRLTHRKQRMAGERPKMRRRVIGGHGGGILFNIGKWVVLAAIAALVILSLVGPYHHTLSHRESRYYHDVVGTVHPTYTAYHATNATATSSAPGFPASNLVDGVDNNSWEAANAGVGQKVVVTFPTAANLGRIGFLNGDQVTPQAFLTEPRPEKVLLQFNGTKPYTKTVTLKDSAAFQTFGIATKGSTTMTLTIESVYPATGGAANTAMTQIEFFTKS